MKSTCVLTATSPLLLQLLQSQEGGDVEDAEGSNYHGGISGKNLHKE
jgi:hypothetical protein